MRECVGDRFVERHAADGLDSAIKIVTRNRREVVCIVVAFALRFGEAPHLALRRRRGSARVFESKPVPPQVVVQTVARNEAGSDAAGHRLQLTFADQRANLVLGAAELNGNLADRQRCGPVHDRSIARCRGVTAGSG